MLAQGEIWWAELPEEGRRPALIVTRDAALPVLRALLVAPITRTIRGIPTEVTLGAAEGLGVACAASFDNLRLVPRGLLTERAGRLDAVRMVEFCRAWSAVADR